MRGTVVSGYEVGELVEATSDMVVYAAFRPVTTGVSRAVTLLAPRSHVPAEVASTFAYATKAFSRISHAAILPIEDFGRPGGPLFAVGPRLSGAPLCRSLGGVMPPAHALSETAAVSLAVQTAQAAVALAHTLGAGYVVQVSPEVVWLTAQGQVHLLPTAIRRLSANRGSSSRFPVQDGGLASEITALLWDLLLMGRTRTPSRNESTEQVGSVVNPALFQLVLEMLSSSSPAGADAFLRSFEHRCGTPAEHAPELASIARCSASPSFQDDEDATAPRPATDERASNPEPTRVSARTTVFRLRVVGKGQLRRVLILDDSRSRWIVGRSSAADLTIDDAAMSREHFAVVREPDGTFSICDLESKNGLMINGQRRPPGTLQPGDEVRAGLTIFRLESHAITAGCDGTGRRRHRAVGSRPL